MANQPSERDCLLIPVNDVAHLHVVMNDPCNEGRCLLVMMSSIKDGRPYDDACTLDCGDYDDFVDRPTYIVYRTAETVFASHIVAMLEKGYYSKKENKISLKIYNRIAEGIYSSDKTRPRIENYARENGIDSYTF